MNVNMLIAFLINKR